MEHNVAAVHVCKCLLASTLGRSFDGIFDYDGNLVKKR